MKAKKRPFKVGIVQKPPVFLNLEQSLLRAESLVKEAVSEGARLVVFPETWLTGYPVWLDFAPGAALWDYLPAKEVYRMLVDNSLQAGDGNFTRLQTLAGKNKIYLVMGMHEKVKNTLYNSMVIFHENGRDFHLHRKLVPTYTEKLIWGRGDGSSLKVLDTDLGKVGGLICWEHWMPFARAYMHSLEEMIHIAQWPAVKELHQLASRHYAFEGQCYVIAAGCVLRKRDLLEGITSQQDVPEAVLELIDSIPGTEKDLIHKGGSSIIGPDSSYITGPVFDDDSTVYGDIDPVKTVWGKLFLDTDGHYARPDIFALKVNTAQQDHIRSD